MGGGGGLREGGIWAIHYAELASFSRLDLVADEIRLHRELLFFAVCDAAS